MQNFTQEVEKKCQVFLPFMNIQLEINSDLFILNKGKVADFVNEIKKTSDLIGKNQNTDSLFIGFYTQRLIQQFDLLKKMVDRQTKNKQTTHFASGYKFAKNLEKLPACERLIEYQKILRALNEKISWLTEQYYSSQDEIQKQQLRQAIQETEYRKQKCLIAINLIA